jgi:RND family efflux transporter MFP subunit
MSQNTPTNASATNLGWLWGLLGGCVLAVVVGLGVYFYMAAAAEGSAGAMSGAQDEEEQGGPPPDAGPPPTSVKVAQVTRETMQQRVMVVGRLLEVKRSVVASEIEGRVTELLTPAGRTVIGGETVMARIDPVWSNLAVQQAEADLAKAKATARQSASELKLLQELKARNAADPQALDDALATAEADAANVQAVEAALSMAKEMNKRVEIIAPFDGIVSAKLTEKGQWLDPGSPVVEVVSNGMIDAVIDVPEQYINEVPKGTPIELTIEPLNMTITGEVIAINPDGSNAARTFPVKVRVDDRDGLFKVGMSVTARVPIRAEKQYLVVPRDAVQYSATGPQVWMSLVMPSSAPGSMPQGIPMDVDVLFGVDGKFAIQPKPKVEGMNLSEGMDVVIEGAERLFPTRPMIVMNSEKGENPDGEGPPQQ